MEKYKILSGEEIVTNGAKKIEATLPEVGLKDVLPNGSWLEQKQIQSALDARKHLIEIERVEKSGVLSQAVWHDDLKLAEITKQYGGHWQFLGHHVRNILYVSPEEALFLMESNCLVLKYNEVIVSLQQAYSLLLSDEISIFQYKVYASLSRLGYKVLRHIAKPDSNETDKTEICSKTGVSVDENSDKHVNEQTTTSNTNEVEVKTEKKLSMDAEVDAAVEKDRNIEMNNEEMGDPLITSNEITVEVVSTEGTENVSRNQNAIIEEISDDKDDNANESIKEIKNVSEIILGDESDVNVKQNNLSNSEKDSSITSEEINSNEVNCTDIEQNRILIDVNDNPSETSEQINLKEESLIDVEKTNLINDAKVDASEISEQANSKEDNLVDVEKKTSIDFMDVEQINLVKDFIENPTITSEETNFNEGNHTNSERNNLVIDLKDNPPEFVDELNIENVAGNKLTNILCTPSEQSEPSVSDNINMEVDENCACSGSFREKILEKTSNENPQPCTSKQSNTITNIDPLAKYCQWKLKKLKNRQSKNRPNLNINESFKDCPNFSENQIQTVNTPKEEYLPKNIFLNQLSYVINMENVTAKNVTRPASTDSTYTDGALVRRQRIEFPQPHTQNSVFPPFSQSFRPMYPFRHQNNWRPSQHNMNYYQFNLFFHRPYISNFYPRFQFFPRMFMPMFPRYSNNPINLTCDSESRNLQNNTRKRPIDDARLSHLENLKCLAQRVKSLNAIGNVRTQNIAAIHSLIQTYNTRFRSRLRLSQEFEIVNDETILDTITLDDDDEESKGKRPRLGSKPDLFLKNFNKISQTALRLKKLEAENKATARHRRALSGVIKTFNKHFDADIHLTDDYDLRDRRHINLDSSSDSDCIVEEEIPKITKGKKLRNPFNILKKRLEKKGLISHSTPITSEQDILEPSIVKHSHEVLEKKISKAWLPGKNDFGRPEIVPRDTMTARIMETKKEEFLYGFLKDQPYKYDNWKDLKIAFLESIEETNAILHTGAMIANNIDIKSLVKTDDCTDMATVLKKISIINANKNITNKSNLTIDYDVYNRDVKHFRKSNRPKPHFRVVCLKQSSAFPSGIDIATLHASIKDNVIIIFAVVGISSISYVQVNPMELPVYMPGNDNST